MRRAKCRPTTISPFLSATFSVISARKHPFLSQKRKSRRKNSYSFSSSFFHNEDSSFKNSFLRFHWIKKKKTFNPKRSIAHINIICFSHKSNRSIWFINTPPNQNLNLYPSAVGGREVGGNLRQKIFRVGYFDNGPEEWIMHFVIVETSITICQHGFRLGVGRRRTAYRQII